MGILRLNLGAGEHTIPGYINIDKRYASDEPGVVEKRRADAYPLNFDSEIADEIRASHLLEHFSHRETLDVLRDWVRVLKPGGVLKVAVPDFRKIAEEYLAGNDGLTLGYVMGGQTHEEDYHRAIFDREMLESDLREAGLVDIHAWYDDIGDGASLPISLNLAGRKPGGQVAIEAVPMTQPEPQPSSAAVRKIEIEIPAGAVKAVLSAPRFGPLDTLFVALNALSVLGIDLEKRGGVFWAQGLTRGMEEALAAGYKYILTLDYDTMFSAQDAAMLYWLMEQYPNADAICPLQVGRGREMMLLHVEEKWPKKVLGEDGKVEVTIPLSEFQADLLPLQTGHFGLTILRASSLRDVSRPWFHAQPDAEGRWEGGRLDDDIYFWHNWARAGKTLYLANRIAVGHLQEMVSWPGPDMGPVHQYLSEYLQTGKPKGVWR